jgi:predicted nucleotidyltransferase
MAREKKRLEEILRTGEEEEEDFNFQGRRFYLNRFLDFNFQVLLIFAKCKKNRMIINNKYRKMREFL